MKIAAAIFFFLIFMSNAFSMGSKRPPADLSAFSGHYEKMGCSIDSPESSTIPHHIRMTANASGEMKLLLETSSSFLTTRVFAIQDTKKTACFEDGGYTAKCKTSYKEQVLAMKANWKCDTYWACTATTPENYSFKLNEVGLSYTEDNSKCEYRKIPWNLAYESTGEHVERAHD